LPERVLLDAWKIHHHSGARVPGANQERAHTAHDIEPGLVLGGLAIHAHNLNQAV